MSGPNLRRVSEFRPSGNELARQLSQLENDVAETLADIAVRGAVRFKPTTLKTANYQALLHDMVLCAGTFNVLLPTATKSNAGRPLAVLVKSGTVTVLSATSLVQGAASEALATNGLRIYYSDGQDWWRQP